MHWITKSANRVLGKQRTKVLIDWTIDNLYHAIKTKNYFRRTFLNRKENKFLFILSPPFCGSTLLNHIISSSSNVSSNNIFHSREGQQLPKVREIMFLNKQRWKPETEFEWPFIKNEWLKYWDITKPILLEKSPCSIVRANVIEKEFQPAYFVAIYRNPYAHCEGLMRRNNWGPTNAAKFAMKCMRFQQKNINQLNNVISFSYEEMSEHPDQVVEKLKQHLPELSDIQLSLNYPTQNVRNENIGVTNLNKEKINNITEAQLDKINIVFKRNIGLLEFFGYDLME